MYVSLHDGDGKNYIPPILNFRENKQRREGQNAIKLKERTPLVLK